MARKAAAIASGVVIAAVGGFFLATTIMAPANRFEECFSGAVAGGDIGGPFTLVSETGETVTEADVITGPTLVYFGYTFCPDVCPMDTARTGQAMDIMDEQGTAVDALFISIDPQRDTPEYLAEFTDAFHPRMIGLTGTQEQVKVAAEAYRSFYQKADSDDPEFYLMDHMTLTYLMTPDDGLVTFFRRDVGPEEMADRVGCFAAST